LPASISKYGALAIRAASASALTQGIAVATGLQSSFSWKEVAISAVSAPIATKVGGVVAGKVGSAFAGNVAAGVTGSLVRSAFGGKIDVANVLADAFGNAIGNGLVSRIEAGNAEHLRERRQGENFLASYNRNHPENADSLFGGMNLSPGEDTAPISPWSSEGLLDYSSHLRQLGSYRFDNPVDPYQRTTTGLVDYGQLALYFAQEINNYQHGVPNDLRALGTYELAVAGDPESAWLLSMAGVGIDDLAALDASEQQSRVAKGLWNSGSAAFEIVTRSGMAASSGGVARGIFPVENRALQLLATGFDGIGTIGAFNAAVQSIPGGSGTAEANLHKIAVEFDAIATLSRLGAIDSTQLGDLRANLASEFGDSQWAKYAGFSGVGQALGFALDAIPEAQGGVPRFLRNIPPVEDIAAALKGGTSVFQRVIDGDFFSLGYFPRGKLGESAMLRQVFNSPLNPGNYRTIDVYDDGALLGTSIKTLDLRALSASDPLLTRKLDNYVQELRDFKGYPGSMKLGDAPYPVDSSTIRHRQLALMVGGRVPDAAQLRSLELAARAAQRGRNPVTVSIYAGK
jgi:hypothetical protein